METSSTITIKVQYGDILRRFKAKVVDLSVGVLTGKILTLFKLGLGTEILLTFTDEDGDSVVVVDDEDLGEMVKQSCNQPLRINVKLNANDGRTRILIALVLPNNLISYWMIVEWMAILVSRLIATIFKHCRKIIIHTFSMPGVLKFNTS